MTDHPYNSDFLVGAWMLDTVRKKDMDIDLEKIKETEFYEGLVTMAEYVEAIIQERELQANLAVVKSDLTAITLRSIIDEFKDDKAATALIEGHLADLRRALSMLEADIKEASEEE